MRNMVDEVNKVKAAFSNSNSESAIITGWHPSFEADVRRLCEEFTQESLKEYGLEVTHDRLSEMIEACKNISFFLGVDGKPQGLIAGFITENMTNKKHYLQEVIWYVSKDYRRQGLRLHKEFEKAATAYGCDGITMVCMKNSMHERLDGLYKSLGYVPVETHYLKELKS